MTDLLRPRLGGSEIARERDKCRAMIRSIGVRGILYRKREAGEPGGEGAGRAWVIEADGTERPINGGDPINRAEAERLARVGEYTFDAEA